MSAGPVTPGVDELDALRCTPRSLAYGETPAGSASTVPAFLLLEHGGPWGFRAWSDAPFPDGPDGSLLGPAIEAACAAARVRGLLVRQHRSKPGLAARPCVLLASCRPGGAAARRTLDHPADALDLPLRDLVATLAAGEVPSGWERLGPQYLVCTHGRHDACCAELGRPVAAALDEADPEATWETSHVGGDRFAANVVVVPDGVYYGRVPPARCAELAAAHASGRVVPDLMRGSTRYPFPVQAAEVALREALGEDRLAALRLESTAPAGDGAGAGGDVLTTVWSVDGTRYRVDVTTAHPGPARRLTCRSTTAGAPPAYTCTEPARLAE